MPYSNVLFLRWTPTCPASDNLLRYVPGRVVAYAETGSKSALKEVRQSRTTVGLGSPSRTWFCLNAITTPSPESNSHRIQ